MRSQWERIVNCLSQVGLSFPMTSETGSTLLEIESVEQFCQEIIITRFVSEAIGRGQARAEIEADAEVIINSKNQEIGRLQDKLQYCEAVNREMSQRNQEIMGMFHPPFSPTFAPFLLVLKTEATAGAAITVLLWESNMGSNLRFHRESLDSDQPTLIYFYA